MLNCFELTLAQVFVKNEVQEALWIRDKIITLVNDGEKHKEIAVVYRTKFQVCIFFSSAGRIQESYYLDGPQNNAFRRA